MNINDIMDLNQERNRVIYLSELDIDELSADSEFEGLTMFAAKVADCPMAQINLVDADMQWTISSFKLDIMSTTRKGSVCQYTIQEDDLLEISDLQSHSKLVDNSEVYRQLNLKYYLGIPLVTSSGYKIGALCVLDILEKKTSREKIRLLKIIAQEVICKIESKINQHSLLNQLCDAYQEKKMITHDLRGPAAGIAGLTNMILQKPERHNQEQLLHLIRMINEDSSKMLRTFEKVSETMQTTERNERELSPIEIKDKLEKKYTQLAEETGVNFRVQILELYPGLRFSKEKIIHMIGSFLSHCMKFSVKGSEIIVRIVASRNLDCRKLEFIIEHQIKNLNLELTRMISNPELLSDPMSYFTKDFPINLAVAYHELKSIGGHLHISVSDTRACALKIRTEH